MVVPIRRPGADEEAAPAHVSDLPAQELDPEGRICAVLGLAPESDREVHAITGCDASILGRLVLGGHRDLQRCHPPSNR
jgi:hypothetical protein